MSHCVPSEQLDRIRRSRYIWFSHGHPDHLNAESVHELSNKPILLPDHVGGRIERDLRSFGLNVRILPTKRWVELSPNGRVMCLPDYNQDATLLIALGSALIVTIPTRHCGARGGVASLRLPAVLIAPHAEQRPSEPVVALAS